MSLLSMTGHGVGEASVGEARIVVEIRVVNHRHLDVRVRLASELAGHAGRVEALCRGALERGRAELVGRVEAPGADSVTLDRDRARDAFRQLAALRDELAPGQPLPLSLLATVPDLFRAGTELDLAGTETALASATKRALGAVVAMRRVEGAALAVDLTSHLTGLVREVDAVRARLPTVVDAYRSRLRSRLSKLLEEAPTSLDEGRLEQEVAVLADRCDVAEELSRLGSHAAQLRGLLAEAEGRRGKRLDFLLQEMTREANTVGSKSVDAELAASVVRMKTAISRMREQAQNVL